MWPPLTTQLMNTKAVPTLNCTRFWSFWPQIPMFWYATCPLACTKVFQCARVSIPMEIMSKKYLIKTINSKIFFFHARREIKRFILRYNEMWPQILEPEGHANLSMALSQILPDASFMRTFSNYFFQLCREFATKS